jgi:hypothetical protein
MKKTVIALLTLVSPLAMAEQTPVSQLPQVSQVSITVSDVGGIAAVQPTASVTVTMKSCDPLTLKVETTPGGDGIVYVKVINTTLRDCRGKAQARRYTLQVSSDATFERYVVLNPIQPNAN